jgi:mannose/fructose/N-acetylgalactosamine-specific phosphotransferase system component IIC
MDLAEVVVFGIVGGLISLDATAFLQVMLSQPMVACGLMGTLWGYPAWGWILGVAFQLTFCSDAPLGTHLPHDASMMSLAALGMAVMAEVPGNRVGMMELLGAAALVAILMDPFFRWTSRAVRRWNELLTAPVRRLLARGSYRPASVLVHGGLLLFFLRASVTLAVAVAAGSRLISWGIGAMPREVLHGARWLLVSMPILGALRMAGQYIRFPRDVMQFLPWIKAR